MTRSVYASREMSHFLMGSAKWWQDDIHSDLKAPGFMPSCIDAFLIYDHIVLDCGAGFGRDFVGDMGSWGETFRQLVNERVIIRSPLSHDHYERIKSQSLEDLIKCIKLLPPETLNHWARRFHYDYLLESPWWLFVREMDLASAQAIRECERDTHAGSPSLRGLLPFLFSAIWSMKAHRELKIPALLSQVEYAIREELLEVGLNRTFRTQLSPAGIIRLREITRDTSEKFDIAIPSFYELCASGSRTRLDILTKAIELRNDPDCRWFRKRFWQIVSEPELLNDADHRWSVEVHRMSERLVRRTEGRFWANLRRIILDVRQCGPICYLLGTNPINSLAEKLGAFLTRHAQESRKRRQLAWRYFLVRNAETPATRIGMQSPQAPSPGATEAYWNAVEKASLARLVISTSSQVEMIIDHIREKERTGVCRLDAETVSAELFLQLQNRGIHYDYEPFSPGIPQRVRLPDAILAPQRTLRVATCLELALVFAAGVEAAHSHPLIAHLIHRSGDAHALAGYWACAPLEDTVELSVPSSREWMEDGVITIVETTGLCADAQFQSSFTVAKERAKETVDDSRWSMNFVLNITAARRHGLLPIVTTRVPE